MDTLESAIRRYLKSGPEIDVFCRAPTPIDCLRLAAVGGALRNVGRGVWMAWISVSDCASLKTVLVVMTAYKTRGEARASQQIKTVREQLPRDVSLVGFDDKSDVARVGNREVFAKLDFLHNNVLRAFRRAREKPAGKVPSAKVPSKKVPSAKGACAKIVQFRLDNAELRTDLGTSVDLNDLPTTAAILDDGGVSSSKQPR